MIEIKLFFLIDSALGLELDLEPSFIPSHSSPSRTEAERERGRFPEL
jgi:hypothetical protein